MEPIKEACCSSPIPHVYSSLSISIEHWFILVLICLVLDLEDATSWYTITMSWPNVPCTELPP